MTVPLSALQPAIGQPVSRVDALLKVTGSAPYTADHPTERLAHAVIVGSTTARGTVQEIKTDAALNHPGVLEVFTDFQGVKTDFDPAQVSSFGQPVAIVVAETLEAAAHGASLVEVRIRRGPALTDIDDPDAAHQEGSRNTDYSRGAAEDALRTADVVTDLRYSIARNYHNPMELAATIANWDGDRLTVWDKTQHVHTTQKDYAEAFGLAAEQVRVISPYVGGAFGNALRTWPHQLLTALAARRLGRSVKTVVTRGQMFTGVGYRPTSRQRVAIGADRSGRIQSVVHSGFTENSRYAGFEENYTGLAKFMYQSPNMTSSGRVVPLDVNPPAPMRGPGAVTGAFALECAMDDLASHLDIDPITFRLRNEPQWDQSDDLPFSTRRLNECFRRGAEVFQWSRRTALPRTVRDDGALIGIGVSGAAYETLLATCTVNARMGADGVVEIRTATSDMGPGTYTSMTQVAADALGVSMTRVRFILGDTDLPEAPVHGGSQTMASVGSGVYTAANMLRDRFIRTAVVDPASPLHGLRPDQVNVNDGRMFVIDEPSRSESYSDLLRRRRWNGLDSEQDWSPTAASEQHSMYGYGAVFAEVAVDEMLGTVRIRRVFGCYDAGRIVNPRLAHSQAIGGIVGGIGMALLEGAALDHRDGRVTNSNLADYLVPVNADVSNIDAEFLPGEDLIADPLGVKGLAELVIVGVPAAIANAVFNATGRRITDLPITLDKLL